MFAFSIDNFGVARKIGSMGDGAKSVDCSRINAIAAERGYIIHPDCCTAEVEEWLNMQPYNYDSTFYQKWEDITSRSRMELLIDQLIHYASTYGTDMQGKPYVPNENFDKEMEALGLSYRELKLISPISDSELYEKCREALYAGIALKDSTLNSYADFIVDYMSEYHTQVHLDSIKNRDAFCILSSKLGIYPKDPISALKALVYAATNSCTIVQNNGLVESIQKGSPVDLTQLSDEQVRDFASIFNRFKRVFLAFKANHEDNAKVINRIGKLSKTLHKPLKKGFWESILEEEKSAEEIADQLKSISNFKKVRIMQLAKERMNPSKDHIYVVRNGKAFVRMDYTPNAVSESYCQMLHDMCRQSLVDSLKSKACTITLPQNCELTLPSSEKTFVGNIPFGTSIKMAENNIVGIYWRNEWGTHDFDLSLIDFNGNKIGWNAAFCQHTDVIYSGDMTNADPEATELMYMSKQAPDSIVCVNRFNGEMGSRFRLFFAQENLDRKEVQELRNYMVDPNSILWDVMMKSENMQQNLGLICDNAFYMMDLQMGNSRVSYRSDYQQAFIENMKTRTRNFVKLADILMDAGFTVVDQDAAIDFSSPNKDAIINLMAG